MVSLKNETIAVKCETIRITKTRGLFSPNLNLRSVFEAEC